MKLSIVTPSYNSEKFISETIDSVISQKGNFEIDYVVIDNCSTDSTIEILKRYEKLINDGWFKPRCKGLRFRWISEKDNGMYDAIKKGFSVATGEIFAWINADDIYLPGAFDVITKVLCKYPQIKWLKGITSYINQSSTVIEAGNCYLYDQSWIQKGIYGRYTYFIQQDSVFWRRELWENAGGTNSSLKRAGDFELWTRFAMICPLYTLKAYLSCFRRVEGQLSQDIDAYYKECEKVSTQVDSRTISKINRYFYFERRFPERLRPIIYQTIFGHKDLFLVELVNGTEPNLKRVNYYVG